MLYSHFQVLHIYKADHVLKHRSQMHCWFGAVKEKITSYTSNLSCLSLLTSGQNFIIGFITGIYNKAAHMTSTRSKTIYFCIQIRYILITIQQTCLVPYLTGIIPIASL